MKQLKVLVACEYSGVVRDAFIKLGHAAMSCDLLPTDVPGPHHQGDVREVLNYPWDLVIAHPPCTYICNLSNCRIKEPGRLELRRQGMEFFMLFTNLKAPHVAIENPRGLPEREYRKADQIIQPYEFGHPVSKATCLWLKNLPPLQQTNRVVLIRRNSKDGGWRDWTSHTSGNDKGKARSKTFQGIADAMADQWSTYIQSLQ